MTVHASETEILLYQELATWFDKYDRQFLHSKEHEALARRIALALVLLRRGGL